ncbi:hypothetical protein IJE86_08275 [bacterium]|nr:hypothetical protein [bacterium]
MKDTKNNLNDEFFSKNNSHKPNGGIDPKAAEALICGENPASSVARLEQQLESLRESKIRQDELNAKILTEFANIPEQKVFAKSTFYKFFNPKNKREFVIDGVMLEGKIGLDSSLYEKVKSRSVAMFYVGEAIVSFYKSIGM